MVTNNLFREVYTDGSFIEKFHTGSWAAVIVENDGNKKVLSGSLVTTKASICEIIAVTEALKACSDDDNVIVYTDYEAIIFFVNKGINIRVDHELWYDLKYQIDRINGKIYFVKVKSSHIGDSVNYQCHIIAKQTALKSIAEHRATRRAETTK